MTLLRIVSPLGAFLFLLTAPSADAAAKMPRFKWGQTKDQLYISVMVRATAAGMTSVHRDELGPFF